MTLILTIRLFNLQITQHEYYVEEALGNQMQNLPITPVRGDILDRNGRVLATNEFSYRLTITPEKVNNLNDTLVELEINEYIDTHDIERFKTIIDIDFQHNLERLYWRGVTTGQLDRTANRFTLVEKYFASERDIDIGFTSIVQEKEAYKKYIKDWGGWQDFLHHKYIISVHGNDADIDLSWKLASHSVVLMAKPQYFTWFMEDLLIPGYHYVLLKDDFSDLREKLDWCKANQDKCKEIIEHAHQYMEIFKDINVERAIEREVLKLYFEKINNKI